MGGDAIGRLARTAEVRPPVPARGRYFADRPASRAQQLPELARVVRPRRAHRNADDRHPALIRRRRHGPHRSRRRGRGHGRGHRRQRPRRRVRPAADGLVIRAGQRKRMRVAQMRGQSGNRAVVEEHGRRQVDGEFPPKPARQLGQADRIEADIGELRAVAHTLGRQLQDRLDAGLHDLDGTRHQCGRIDLGGDARRRWPGCRCPPIGIEHGVAATDMIERAFEASPIAGENEVLRRPRDEQPLPGGQPFVAFQETLPAAAQVQVDALGLDCPHAAVAPQRPGRRHRAPRTLARRHARIPMRGKSQLIAVRPRVIPRATIAQHGRRRGEAAEEIERLARRRLVERPRARHLRRHHGLELRGRALEQAAARLHAGRVDHAVQPLPARAKPGDDLRQRVRIGDVNGVVDRVAGPELAQLGEQRVGRGIGLAPPKHGQPRVIAAREMGREQAPQAARAARD
ncbi:hypothetical protein BUGL105410_37580 [Burkholderia gladioli]